ncbi:MAG: SGNH/GDSL hydrolase family protein [Planctomycetota bacterium]
MKEKALWKAGLILGSFLAGLLIMEVTVRVLHIAPQPLAPLPIPTFRLSENPIISYEFIPDYKPTDQAYHWSHEGYLINSAGFRDREYDEAKTEGTYRIIVLGDSTTAGNGVRDLDKTYTKLLEKRLNADAHPGRRFQVLNMGVGGYHTMQEVETLRAKGMQYEPDLVLLTFCMNDFDLHADGGVHRKLSRMKQYSFQDTDTTLYNSVLRRSRLAFILHHRLKSPRSEYEQWYANDVLDGESPVAAGLKLLSELQQKHGFPALVLILPEFSAPFDQYQSRPIHKKVFAAAEGLPGITVVDLLEGFAKLDTNAKKFAREDSLHMNEVGHEAMAEVLLPIVRSFTENETLESPTP